MAAKPAKKTGRKTPAKKPDTYDIEASLGYLVNSVARLSLADLKSRLASLNIKPGQIPLIVWLLEEDGLTQSDLCQKANIEQPSVAEMLRKMEKDGVISRRRDAKDGRKYCIYLTAKIRRKAAEIYLSAHQSNQRALAGLSKKETETFLKTLHRIIANLHD